MEKELWEWEEIEKSIPNKPFFSLKEVATILGLTYRSIYEKVRRGEILATRVGYVWIIPREELKRYLMENANLNN